jgi:hypothetical protein
MVWVSRRASRNPFARKCLNSSAPQRHTTQPRPIRALTIFDSLPRNYRTLRIADDASAPHLKAGEYAVIDTTDRELQAGELYVIQYESGDRRRTVMSSGRSIQIARTPIRAR